jgi:hypothetical protein
VVPTCREQPRWTYGSAQLAARTTARPQPIGTDLYLTAFLLLLFARVKSGTRVLSSHRARVNLMDKRWSPAALTQIPERRPDESKFSQHAHAMNLQLTSNAVQEARCS